MNNTANRRDFLKTAAVGLLAFTAEPAGSAASTSAAKNRIEAFDYRGVRLLDGPWQRQYEQARDYYLHVSNDDILKGFRGAAGLPAPGQPLGGWCRQDSSTIFGQWLSGMARMYRATGDAAMRDKAIYLRTEFAKTIKADGDCRMRHYPWDKLVCGLVDLGKYGEDRDAAPLLEKITDFASRNFDHRNNPADPTHNQHYYGDPQEWYTLSENLYRAYQLTGDPKFKSFAEVWLYTPYWSKFAKTAAPSNVHGVHAYSHVNTFSGAAMAYAVSGDPVYLAIIKNFYDYMQNCQCYATGGYGPNERFMAPGGSLGRALDTRSDTFETVCGSWAGFKLSRYLMQFTGEARYGDWIERLFYNGVGAALPIADRGKNFYYADYRVGGGMKVYNWDNYTCCSGTYIQNVADYHNLIYYNDPAGLYVNLYVPSELQWGGVKLTQQTRYPESDTIMLTLETPHPVPFRLSLRIPAWTRDASAKVNGAAASVPCIPGTWASIDRTWNTGDKIELRIPLSMRMEPVDRWHPDRVAVVRGPVVLALEGMYHDPVFRLPEHDDDLSAWIKPDETTPGDFRVHTPDGKTARLKLRPFYAFGEVFPYAMYFDRKSLPYALW